MQSKHHQLPDPHIIDPIELNSGWTPEEIREFEHSKEAERAKAENAVTTGVTDFANASQVNPPF